MEVTLAPVALTTPCLPSPFIHPLRITTMQAAAVNRTEREEEECVVLLSSKGTPRGSHLFPHISSRNRLIVSLLENRVKPL
jgi:hypothetical protein